MQKAFSGNQKGQAIIELSLMMLFLAVILLGMIFTGLYLSDNVNAAEQIRHQMRVSMYQSAPGPFKSNTKVKDVSVDLPGLMKRIFRTPSLQAQHRIEFYEGSYAGRGKSYYVERELYRKIEL